MTVIDLALKLVVEFEGFRSAPYQNPGDRPTIGYGSTFKPDDTPVTMQTMPLLLSTASDWAAYTLKHIQSAIQHETRFSPIPNFQFNDNQLAALMDFAYNLGLGRLFASTLWFRAVRNDQVAFAHFMDYVYANGARQEGLTERRRAEQKLFQTPVSPVMPQPLSSPPQPVPAPVTPQP